jgi:hypothetical protein
MRTSLLYAEEALILSLLYYTAHSAGGPFLSEKPCPFW